MKTKLKSRPIFLGECNSYVSRLQQNILNAAHGKSTISFGSKITNLNLLDVRRIVYETKLEDETNKLIRNVILEMIQTGEQRCPGISFYAALNFCSCFLSNTDAEIKLDIKELCSLSRRTNLETITAHLKEISRNDETFKLLNSVIERTGFNTIVSVESWEGWNSKIDVWSSFDFEAYLPEAFQLMTKIQRWNTDESDVLTIDGIIETVGEIHHLLERYSTNKKKLCIIARGFSEEVIATLATNFLRKTLVCVPVIIPSNLNTINSLKDISIVAGADMISSLKGDLISNIKQEQIARVQYLDIDSRKILIKNSNQILKVHNHIQELRRKMDEESEDVKKLLEKRILSLSPQSASISIGRHAGETAGLIKDRLNLSFAILNSSCKYGIIKIEDITKLSLNLNNTVNKLRDLDFKICPAASLIEGFKISTKAAQNIKKSGIFIVID